MIKRKSIRCFVAVAVLSVAASCSSSKPTKASGGTTTTVAPADAAPYAKKGAYAVGYTTLHLAGGRRVVVWYPAQPGSTEGHKQEPIDLASMLSPELKAKVPLE